MPPSSKSFIQPPAKTKKRDQLRSTLKLIKPQGSLSSLVAFVKKKLIYGKVKR